MTHRKTVVAKSSLYSTCFVHDLLLLENQVRRDRVQALSLFERAVKEHPSHVAILIKFAGVRKACGDLDGAQELYQRASQLEGEVSSQVLFFPQEPRKASDIRDIQ